MTSNKIKKKKDREKKIKEKLLKKKKAILKQKKYDKSIDADIRANRPKLVPYQKDKDPDVIREKIAKNLEILKGLEAEQEADKKSKEELSKKIAAEGKDIKDVLKAISNHQINNSQIGEKT